MDFDSDHDANYDLDSDESADAEMSDDGTTAESDYELNSAETDQMLETEQACTPNYDSDAERDVEGNIIMDHWNARGTWYNQSYYIGDYSDDNSTSQDTEKAEESSNDSDDQEDTGDTEKSSGDSDEEENSDLQELGFMPRKSRFTNDSSARFTEMHNDETGELMEEEEEESDNWLKKLKILLGIDENEDEESEDDEYY